MDVDRQTEQRLGLYLKPGQFHHPCARQAVDQQIEIAVLIIVATGHGAEYPRIGGAVPANNFQQRCAMLRNGVRWPWLVGGVFHH